jgi:hypothetical protein
MNATKEMDDEIARRRYTFNNIIQEFNTMLDTLPLASSPPLQSGRILIETFHMPPCLT